MQGEGRVLVTGANGWVGQRVIMRASKAGRQVRGAARTGQAAGAYGDAVSVGDLDENTNWQHALSNCRVVVHTAARVHMMHDATADPLQAYRRVNVEGSLNLARQAAQAGIQRFIFISSVKVNGEQTRPGHPFRAEDTPAPQDPYGISKMEAEVGLRAIAQQTGMEVVIIRPPLVYGPGVKANFASMVQWLQRGVPLPLGAIHNRRSLVALDNLVDLIITCLDHPAAANQTLMVSDGEDVSTTELLQRMAAALGKPARLVPVPQRVLALGAALLGKQAVAQRLFSSLQVDIGPTCALLGWKPPVSLADGLLQVARHASHLP